jgi:beta-galactosidase
MRRTISLDGRWKILPPKVSHEPILYEKELEFDFQGVDVDTGTWDNITVPSNWHMVYPDTYPIPPERNYWYGQVGHDQYVSSWYRTMFTLSEQVCGERVVIRFNQVGHEAHVWVNGREVGGHKGSFTAFDFDITDYVVDGDNVLAVWVCNDFGTNPPKRTYGKMFSSWSNVGGIVGHVSLLL